MQVTFKGQHLAIPEPIKDHARRRMTRLDRYLPPTTEVVLELRKEETRAAEQRYVAQATVIDAGSILRAEERARDMELAVDATVEKLSRQASRYSQRRHRKDRTSLPCSISSEQGVGVESAVDDTPFDDDEAEAQIAGRVVRVKRFAVKPMSVEEAIEQVDLLGHDFFLFYSADEGRYAVLYRRSDHGYGLIIPEAQ